MNQTTINHLFKKGDKVRLKDGATTIHFIVIAIEFYNPYNEDGFKNMYRIKNPENGFIAWVSEDRITLITEGNDNNVLK